MGESVLVIGAGPAGIAAAYYLEKAEIAYKVVDSSSIIASTWDSLYPSLRLNTTRFYSHLPEAKFPLKYGIFPTGKAYHRYLVDFATKHRFNIHLGVTVERIEPCNDGWMVKTNEGEEWYPCVISASGRFNNPYIPPIEGVDQFKGTLIHAHDYTSPEPFVHKRVMVVGNGPSGLDISVEIGKQNAPRYPVLLSMRTGIVLRPRYPLGLPKHLWMIIGDHLPKFIGKPLEKWIESRQFKDLDKIGIKTPSTGTTSAAASTRGPELIYAVRAGQVICVDGVQAFDERGARLLDGSYHELDAVILGTGYRPVLYQYFDYHGEVDQYGWPLRDFTRHYNGREVVGYPGLYLVGVFYQGKGAMYNFNVEAQIAVEQIKERLTDKVLSKV
jgi:putative flavoprotein involved in K+ transport